MNTSSCLFFKTKTCLFKNHSVLKTSKKFGINRPAIYNSKENGADERRERACGTAAWGMWALVQFC